MKTFLGLPVVQSTNLWGFWRHILSVILFTAFGYFGTSILWGFIQGDAWKYTQSVEKYYIEQAVFLILGVIICNYLRVYFNTTGDRFSTYPKLIDFYTL